MDITKMDARWERLIDKLRDVKGLAQDIWKTVALWLGIAIIIAIVIFIPYFIWDMFAHPIARHTAWQASKSRLRWYLIWMVAYWLLTKIWKWFKKRKETDSDVQPSVQASESEDHQGSLRPKNRDSKIRSRHHRRVQRRA